MYTSPSTFNNMVDIVGLDKIKEKINIAIGPQTFKALEQKEVNGFMCKVHTEDGLLKEIQDILK